MTLVPLDFALTLPLFYVVRGLGGALSAAVLPAVLAHAAEASTVADRPQRFAMIASATTLGFLLGPAIGNWLSSMALVPLARKVCPRQGGTSLTVLPISRQKQ